MKTRQILYSIAIGGLIGAGLCQIGIARADTLQDAEYLALLSQAGVSYQSSDAAIMQGHAICIDIGNGRNGEQEAQNVLLYTRVDDLNMARNVVIAAVTAYCPQYDHRGDNTAPQQPRQGTTVA
jgi:hypothetical protein